MMKWIWIIVAVLFPNIFQSYSIQTSIHRPIRFADQVAFPTRHFRHVDSSQYGINVDWENGLREATIQALSRERYGDGNLRKHIYSAPLIGKQNKATPFGDIAILARGQLFANYAGFIFVQDQYQNDCDDCHNMNASPSRGRCINNHCQIWHPKNNEQLIALWKIRRIRHRSLQDSHRYEVEFTISPVGIRHQNGGYLTNEGTFNYNLPGHVFILKSSESHHNLDNEQNNYYLRHGAFIAQTPDGRKYILQSFPGGLPTPETPRYHVTSLKKPFPTTTSSTTEYSEEDEKKVYQTLLEVLNKKTSPEINRFTSTPRTSTTLSDATLVRFPDSQMVPITELDTPFVTKSTAGYITVRFPNQHTSPIGSTQGQTVIATSPSRVTPQSYGIMRPQTTPQAPRTTESRLFPTPDDFQSTRIYTTFAEPHTTDNEIPQTLGGAYAKPKPLHTSTSTERPQIYGNTPDMMSTTTKPPYKMTFHFFAAEEDKETTPSTFKEPSTTIRQEKYTEYGNFLSNTLVPTEPTNVYTSESATTETKTATVLKETNKYVPVTAIKQSFPSKTTGYKYSPTTAMKVTRPLVTNKYVPITAVKQSFPSKTTGYKYSPTTAMKLTKPFVESTKSYSNLFTTSSVYYTTEPSTKIIPSISLEPSTRYTVPFKGFPTIPLESTVGTTLTEENKYSTTYQEIPTITQAPKSTFKEPTVPEGKTKYSTTEFTNPTSPMTKLTSIKDVTVFETPVSTTEIEEPSRETTFMTYPKTPIEASLGVTKIMGLSQNKTTDMVYYAAEETEVPSKAVTQNLVPSNFMQTTQGTVQTTEPTLETQTDTSTTPKRIVTTIGADGTVSIKTTPISADEELFGTTKKYKATKVPKITTTTDSSGFLIDDGTLNDYKVPLFKTPLKDYSEDDIFGSVKNTSSKASKNTSRKKPYVKSDLEKALFDTDNQKFNGPRRRKSSTTEPPPNVIYSDFFEASTIPMTTLAYEATTTASVFIVTPSVTLETARASQLTSSLARKIFSHPKKKRIADLTTETVPIATTMAEVEKINYESERNMPVTSQSYLTSISYEVNKRKKDFVGNLKEKSQSVSKHVPKKDQNVKEVKPTMPGASFDNDFALRLVGQAKGLEYLEQLSTSATTLPSISAKTTKKSKYARRRNYTARAKRPSRKKNVKRRETQ